MAGMAPAVLSKLNEMILDDVQPTWDGRRVESRLVRAPIGIVYRTVVETDFLDAGRSSRPVRVLFAIRTSIERLVSAVTGRKAALAPAPATLKLLNIPRHGEWVKLGEDPPREIAFGAIGRFWDGAAIWQVTNAEDFAHFTCPGNAKIGCLILLDSQDGSTRVTYEARTAATDPASRRVFLRYWRFVSPMVGVVMRSTLSVIARNVARVMQRAIQKVRCMYEKAARANPFRCSRSGCGSLRSVCLRDVAAIRPVTAGGKARSRSATGPFHARVRRRGTAPFES